jgi:imidazolonepropionase-like amidohydrolase
MRLCRRLLLLVLVACILSACAESPSDTAATEGAASLPGTRGPIAIENVTVVPMDRERTMPGQTVVIQAGQIATVGEAGTVEVPDGATRVDGSGQFLMPGLAEMHAHLPVHDEPAGFRDAVLRLFALNGVTFARGMQGGPDHPPLRDAIAAGERFGPTLRVSGPFMSGSIDSPDSARGLVQAYHETGYDLLKIGEGLSPEVYAAIVDEARSLDMPFAGHVADDVGLVRSLEAGQRTVDHFDNYLEAMRTEDAPTDYGAIFGVLDLVPHLDRDRMDELVAATEAAGTGNVPTMVLWDLFFADRPAEEYRSARPEVRYMPPGIVDQWTSAVANMREDRDPERGQAVIALRNELLQAYAESDAPLLLGSDAPQIFNVPGFSLHREMQYMQDEAGMTPYDVLVSGTRAIAEFYGESDTFGTVQEGRRADLILVNGNPLDDVAHASDMAGVVVRGRWLDADEIQSRLDELAAQWE